MHDAETVFGDWMIHIQRTPLPLYIGKYYYFMNISKYGRNLFTIKKYLHVALGATGNENTCDLGREVFLGTIPYTSPTSTDQYVYTHCGKQSAA